MQYPMPRSPQSVLAFLIFSAPDPVLQVLPHRLKHRRRSFCGMEVGSAWLKKLSISWGPVGGFFFAACCDGSMNWMSSWIKIVGGGMMWWYISGGMVKVLLSFGLISRPGSLAIVSDSEEDRDNGIEIFTLHVSIISGSSLWFRPKRVVDGMEIIWYHCTMNVCRGWIYFWP